MPTPVLLRRWAALPGGVSTILFPGTKSLIFLRGIAQSLQAHCPGAAQVDKAALHIGAVAFIHRFGSSLNEHVHFHVCVVDGVFEVVAGEVDADAQATAPGVFFAAPNLRFHPASGIDEAVVAQMQADLRRRILRAFVGRGLIESCDAKEMLAYQHSGFSVDAGVCIDAHDRAALERLLRYCARPPFAMDRLRTKRALSGYVYQGSSHIGTVQNDGRVVDYEMVQVGRVAGGHNKLAGAALLLLVR